MLHTVRMALLPEQLDGGDIELRRVRPELSDAIYDATVASFDELHQWMIWANDVPSRAVLAEFLTLSVPPKIGFRLLGERCGHWRPPVIRERVSSGSETETDLGSGLRERSVCHQGEGQGHSRSIGGNRPRSLA